MSGKEPREVVIEHHCPVLDLEPAGERVRDVREGVAPVPGAVGRRVKSPGPEGDRAVATGPGPGVPDRRGGRGRHASTGSEAGPWRERRRRRPRASHQTDSDAPADPAQPTARASTLARQRTSAWGQPSARPEAAPRPRPRPRAPAPLGRRPRSAALGPRPRPRPLPPHLPHSGLASRASHARLRRTSLPLVVEPRWDLSRRARRKEGRASGPSMHDDRGKVADPFDSGSFPFPERVSV